DCEKAEQILVSAVATWGELDLPLIRGEVESAYAMLRSAEGRLDDALTHHLSSRELFHRAGALREEALAMGGIGYVYLERGLLAEAEDQLSAGLAVIREVADRRGEAHLLADLGMVRVEQGRHDQAAALFAEALGAARDVGDGHWLGVLHGYAGQ